MPLPENERAARARAFPVDPTRLEFLRAGIGLLLDTDEGPVQVVYVSRGADDRAAAWECGCRRGRQGRACDHVPVLEAQVDACHELWGGRSCQPLIEAAGWHRLARACFDGRAVDCGGTRVVARIGQRRAVQVFKLLAEATLEERIDAIIEGKRQLLEAVVAVDDPHLAKVFSREELLLLLQAP